MFRFCFGSIYHLHHFNADAHPGNYLLMPDGRVAFLDFGMTKQLDSDQIELEVAALAAVFDDDPERLRLALHDLGFLRDPKKVDAEQLMQHVRAIGGWYMEDAEVTIDSARVMDAIAAVSDPRSEFYRLVRRENLPANELMGRRMETGVLAVLAQLARHAELAPDRARMVVRRVAGHRARRARVGLLRGPRGTEARRCRRRLTPARSCAVNSQHSGAADWTPWRSSGTRGSSGGRSRVRRTTWASFGATTRCAATTRIGSTHWTSFVPPSRR